MGKNKGTRYSQLERDELLARYRHSGQSMSRFCSEMDISYGTLQRWLGRAPSKQSFIEVAQAVPTKGISLRARLPNGIDCELGSNLTRNEAITWIRELARC